MGEEVAQGLDARKSYLSICSLVLHACVAMTQIRYLFALCLLLDQRALAAFLALFFRSEMDIVSRLRLPPILPPLRPISAIALETREASIGASSEVDRATTAAAIWFESLSLLLMRFGM
jgi:hypothetical protein